MKVDFAQSSSKDLDSHHIAQHDQLIRSFTAPTGPSDKRE